MLNNKEFYPTPINLIIKMLSKVDWKKAKYICEPSAGSGNIINQIRESRGRYERLNIHAIEKDENLRNMLIGAGEKVIGKDFLTYAGLIQFDTIIMNPPFSNGDAHLLKAIEILYSGQIVCLLNAETIRNPCTNQRKDLVRKLEESGAEIKYIENAFLDAERKTAVEIALITIKVERDIEKDLLEGANDKVKEYIHEHVDEQIKDLANNDNIVAIVDDYNFRVNSGIELIHSFWKDSKYVGSYLGLSVVGADGNCITIQDETNQFLETIRHDFWNKVLSLPEFEKRLTEKKRKEFRETIKKNSDLEFTVSNVRAFFENLMGSYEETLIDAIEELFDTFTRKYSFDECDTFNKNVHYYNGWKTNDAFKVNKKVIIPRFGIDPYDYDKKRNKLYYDSYEKLNDIDKVMNYFDGKTKYLKMSEVAREANGTVLIEDIIESEYFKIRFYKKGTTHLTFKDEGIRRRFNIEVGKKKGWLPQNYGYVPMKELSFDSQEIVKSFEDDIKHYDANLNQIGLAKKDLIMIGE